MKRAVRWCLFFSLAAVGCAASTKGESESAGQNAGADAGPGRKDASAQTDAIGAVPEASGIDVGGPAESCDGLDNDGDGEVDEGCDCTPGKKEPCFLGDLSKAGIGECVKGTHECVDDGMGSGKWGPCQGSGSPSTETCDGKDNDCDGNTDEGCPCVDGKEQSCSNECGAGTQKCVNGKWGECSAPQPTAESCNAKDDDCDGQTDEQLLRNCSTPCGAGTQQCQNGSWSECSAPQPTTEVCNDKDDDCDGQTDEDNVCPGCSAQTVSWDGCQGRISFTPHGSQAQVENTMPSKAGTATFRCEKGSWIKVSGQCGASLCTHDWGSKSESFGEYVKIYVALLNRCPDPSGLYSWNHMGYTDQRVFSFTQSQEAKKEFQNFASPDYIVTHIYHTAFLRSPDQSGHDFWVGKFNDGTYRTNDASLGAFVRTFLANPGGDDKTALQKRVEVASYWAQQLIVHHCPWDDFGRTILSNVGAKTNVPSVKAKIDQKISEMERTIKK